MTLVGLGLPMIPDNNARPTVCARSATTTPSRPPSTLAIRPHTYAIGKVPACFFELLKQIPIAIPVRCSDPTGIIRLSLHIPSSSEVDTPEGHDLDGDTDKDDTLEQRLLTNRRLLESRIKSLRLEIGDLSVAENLEKLCNHYFHLDKNNPNKERSDEFNRKLDMLLNEKCGGERKSCHEKWDASTSHEKIDPIRGHEPSKLVTFDLNAQKSDDDDDVKTSRHSSGFGLIFHGLLSKKETQNLLRIDGQYLIRHVLGEEAYILSFRCNGIIQNFRIFKDSEFYDLFYLEDRKASYASLDEMVNDGLRTLFLNFRAGSYVDTLTELAQINKHDSMISWLTSSSPTSLNSPDSRASIYIGSSRRPSVNPHPNQGQSQDEDGLPPIETTPPLGAEESELFTHFFLLGTRDLGKRSPCDLESCPSRSRACLLRGGANPPVGKETCVCRDCGLTLHEKCLEHLDESKFATCMPDLYKMPAIFGVDLTTVVKATMVTSMTEEDPVSIPEPTPPFVVTKCVQEIERIGVTSEGIYRISGSQDAVLKMQKLLERDRMSADLAAFTSNDIDSVCALLKLYLRLLPEPLISRDVFSKLMEDRQNNILTLTTMRQTLTLLPPAHKVTLRYLLAHWDRVVAQEDVNKMSSHNLSRVLVPSIVADTMTLTSIDMGAHIFDMLLTNCNTFDFWGQ